MAGSASSIQELRTRLEQSRWQLHEGLSRLEDRLQEGGETQPSPPAVAESDDAPALSSFTSSSLSAPSVAIPGLPERQAARIMLVALMAGLAAGLSWSRRPS